MSYQVIYEDLGYKDYKETWDYQEGIFNNIISDKKLYQTTDESEEKKITPGVFIFVEHPHVYTLGKSGSENNLLIKNEQLKSEGVDFYKIDRGGDITYHGPGQIVGYPVFDLSALNIGLKDYIHGLEEAVIKTLEEFNISSSRFEGGTGVWLDPESKSNARKICAIGVKASRYVTMHGFALNVNTNLIYFDYINPCGFTDKRVTSIESEKGTVQDMDSVKSVLRRNLKEVFDLEWINQK